MEARGFFSEGLFTLSKQLQRVRLLLLGQTDALSSPAPTSLQTTETRLTWKSGSRLGGRGEAPPKVTEPYGLVAPPPIGPTAEGTQAEVRFTIIQLSTQILWNFL